MIMLAVAVLLVESSPRFTLHRDRPLADSIVLELSTDRRSYIVGEPLEFRLLGRNKSDSVFHGPLTIDPLITWTRVQVRRDSGASRVLQFYPFTPVEDHLIRKLAPKESFSEQGAFAFDYARRSLLLDEPGTYEFKATYCDRPGDPNATLESNVWTVEVEPAPDRYRDAFEAYRKLDVASLATWPPHFVDLTGEEILAAFDFLDSFPDSPWTRFVRRGLVPAVQRRVLHKKAPPEEEQRIRLLWEREAAEREAGR